MVAIKQLSVSAGGGVAGDLVRESHHVFRYLSTDPAQTVSLNMPIRAASYNEFHLHPIFAMNLPEGALHQAVTQQLAKQHLKINDMAILALLGHNQIGRLRFSHENFHKPSRKGITLKTLLGDDRRDDLMAYLLEEYYSSGISGFQPKFVVPDEQATMVSDEWIVKFSGSEHMPYLNHNEFLCMEVAKMVGVNVPEFWLSDNAECFVMKRFDRIHGQMLGFEDMAVLAGKKYHENGKFKFEGSYEGLVRILEHYLPPLQAVEEKSKLFEYIMLCCLLGNGDGHLKNFGLLYTAPDQPESFRLAPLYDVTCTVAYDFHIRGREMPITERTLALKLGGSRAFPNKAVLLKFATLCAYPQAEHFAEKVCACMIAALATHKALLPKTFHARLQQEWENAAMQWD